MPDLTEHQSNATIKGLVVGNSGAGKTGAIAMLAEHGYRVIVADIDNGLDIAAKVISAEAAKNFFFWTFTKQTKVVGNNIINIGSPRIYKDFIASLKEWPDNDLGSIYDWGPETVFVIDSFTFLSNAAAEYVASMMNKPAITRDWDVYREAQGLLRSLLEMLSSSQIRCNILVCCHIDIREDEATKLKEGFPASIGKALGPQIGTYFNTIIEAKVKGIGRASKRIIRTRTDGIFKLKVPIAPGADLKDEYPIEEGIPAIFKMLREHGVQSPSGS